jgi:hypothetical protein
MLHAAFQWLCAGANTQAETATVQSHRAASLSRSAA